MDKQDETAQEAMQRIVDEHRNPETSVDKLARLRADSDQRRVPSDPNRDTSGDSVYNPEPREIHPGEVWSGHVDMRDSASPDSPVTINGYQSVQVMPLSQYDAEKDLLIINVMVGKMRPDRARHAIHDMRQAMAPMLERLGWKNTLFVPVTYDHPMHRQFRTVNVVDLHGMSNSEKQEVIAKIRDQIGKLED